ncbi:LOW QUALITY PROTEIN: hypothetical protein MAR_027559, partial [Mya arenaria]
SLEVTVSVSDQQDRIASQNILGSDLTTPLIEHFVAHTQLVNVQSQLPRASAESQVELGSAPTVHINIAQQSQLVSIPVSAKQCSIGNIGGALHVHLVSAPQSQLVSAPQSQLVRVHQCSTNHRSKAQLGSATHSQLGIAPDTQLVSVTQAQLSSDLDSLLVSDPQAHQESAPQSQLGSAPATQLVSAQQAQLGSATQRLRIDPDFLLGSTPNKQLGSALQSKLSRAPQAQLGSASQSHLRSAPDSQLGSSSQMQLVSAPRTQPGNATPSQLGSAPDSSGDSAPDFLLGSVPTGQLGSTSLYLCQQVEVDCSGIFKPGQLGLALGRGRISMGLRVINFNRKYCIKQQNNVRIFMNEEDSEEYRHDTDLVGVIGSIPSIEYETSITAAKALKSNIRNPPSVAGLLNVFSSCDKPSQSTSTDALSGLKVPLRRNKSKSTRKCSSSDKPSQNELQSTVSHTVAPDTPCPPEVVSLVDGLFAEKVTHHHDILHLVVIIFRMSSFNIVDWTELFHTVIKQVFGGLFMLKGNGYTACYVVKMIVSIIRTKLKHLTRKPAQDTVWDIGYDRQKNGVAVKFRNETNCKLIGIHCICHRLALAYTDTLEDAAYFKQVQMWLVQWWKLFENSPKKLVVYFKVQTEIKSILFKADERRDIATHRLNSLSYVEGIPYSPANTLKHCTRFVNRSFKFVSAVYILAEVLPHLHQLSNTFQFGSIGLSQVLSTIQYTNDKLDKIADSMSPCRDLEVDGCFNILELSPPDNEIKSMEYMCKKYTDALKKNIEARFAKTLPLLSSLVSFDAEKVTSKNYPKFKNHGAYDLQLDAEWGLLKYDLLKWKSESQYITQTDCLQMLVRLSYFYLVLSDLADIVLSLPVTKTCQCCQMNKNKIEVRSEK